MLIPRLILVLAFRPLKIVESLDQALEKAVLLEYITKNSKDNVKKAIKVIIKLF